MAAPPVDINYVAVLVAGIASMIIASLWYSPLLFGNMWMKLGGMGKKDMDAAKKKGMGKLYLIAFISSLLMFYVLAHFIDYTNAKTAVEGIQAGFWVWLGFVATIGVGSVLWENKPWGYYLINAAYWLANLAVGGAILAVWV